MRFIMDVELKYILSVFVTVYFQNNISTIQNFCNQDKSIIFLIVLYGCETWSPNLKEEYKLHGVEKEVWNVLFV
jgi:hypothetical protein